MLLDERVLFSFARLVGNPLRTDAATASLKRPSVARLLVEVDLLKPRPDKIWIQLGDEEGFWQKLTFENVPDYCSHCWHVGHQEQHCHVHHPEFRGLVSNANRNNQKYVPKEISKGKEKEVHPTTA